MVRTQETSREINGVTFDIKVVEKRSPRSDRKRFRRVDVLHPDRPEMGKYLYKDTRYSETSGGFLSSKEETFLADLDSHVSGVINEAVAKYFNRKEDEAAMKEQMDMVLEAADDVWSEKRDDRK